MKLQILILATILFIAQALEAVPVKWASNGHYYDLVLSLNIDWFTARNAAQALTHNGMPGYLATITSQAEQDFIVSTFLQPADINAAYSDIWLGGFQPPGTPEPGGGWQWVSGEAWGSYANWYQGEPNNIHVEEDVLEMSFRIDTFGKWNDAPYDGTAGNYGFLVEYNPSSVPDTGSTCGLLLVGLSGLGVLGRRWRRCAL